MTERHTKTITRIPRLCLHKGTGQARAKFRGRDHYFGRYGSTEAHRRYAQWIVEITGNPSDVPPAVRARAGQAITIAELVNAFEEHLETTLSGRTEDAIRTARSDARVAGDLLIDRHASVHVTDFDAPMLVDIRDRVVRRGWCRRTLNARIGHIRRFFRWGVERGLVDRVVLAGLDAVASRRPGSSIAPELPPVKEVPIKDARAVIEHLEARGGSCVQVACLLRFMLMTGCRSAEARKARLGNLDRQTRTLTVVEHKTIRKTGEPLMFHLSDEVLAVIDRALLARGVGADPDAPLFASKRGAFQRTSVAQAVARACERVGVRHWSPHQLRHTATNLVRREAGDAVAKATGGWDDLRMVHRYGREDDRRQRQAGQMVLARVSMEAMTA